MILRNAPTAPGTSNSVSRMPARRRRLIPHTYSRSGATLTNLHLHSKPSMILFHLAVHCCAIAHRQAHGRRSVVPFFLSDDSAGYCQRETMESVVMVSRSEWDAFLSEHSRLIQKFQLLLDSIDVARTRIEGLRERTEQQMAKSGETLRQIKTTLDRLCEETERQLLES